MDTLQLNIRTPKGMKKEHDNLNYIANMINIVATFPIFKGVPGTEEIKNMGYAMDRFSKEQIQKINDKFGKSDDKPLIIIKNNISYTKADASSYKKFIESINDISSFLKTLKGFHKKPLKNLKITFVPKTKLRGKASYKTELDELWININSMGNTKEEYGSLRYVVLHELGHRYLVVVKRQKWDIDATEWLTTKYSSTDSWNGEEKFAELFAISNWQSKYKEHSEKMEKFKKIIQ